MIPVKTIVGTLTRVQNGEFWEDPSNALTNGKAYRWRLTFTVTPTLQSDPNTPTPYQYNGETLDETFWVADIDGKAYKIVSFISKTTTQVVLLAEDVEFQNSINDASSTFNGAPSRGSVIFFQLSEIGLPILYGIQNNTYASSSITNILTRFNRNNPTLSHILVKQTNHGFVLGDIIKVDDEVEGRYDLADATNNYLAVGIVNSVGSPSSEYFSYKPFGEIVYNVNPPLVGNYGDVYYLDPANPGKLTTTKPQTKTKPIYIRLNDENTAIQLSTVLDTDTITKIFNYGEIEENQTEFQMPSDALDVIEMSINGIENTNFVFDAQTGILTFDPVATGYGVDPLDQLIFSYTASN